VFPLYHIFADLAELDAPQVLPLRSSDPLRVEGLAIVSGALTRLLVANVTHSKQTVELPVAARSARVRVLDVSTVQAAMIDPESYRAREGATHPIAAGRLRLELSPFASVCVDLA
jgi:hypothetical protein